MSKMTIIILIPLEVQVNTNNSGAFQAEAGQWPVWASLSYIRSSLQKEENNDGYLTNNILWIIKLILMFYYLVFWI